jgi:hypothetical protein
MRTNNAIGTPVIVVKNFHFVISQQNVLDNPCNASGYEYAHDFLLRQAANHLRPSQGTMSYKIMSHRTG